MATLLNILASRYNNRRQSWDELSLDDIESVDDVDALTCIVNSEAERASTLANLQAIAEDLGFQGTAYAKTSESGVTFCRVTKRASGGINSETLLGKLKPKK